jgi:hypothetical protein
MVEIRKWVDRKRQWDWADPPIGLRRPAASAHCKSLDDIRDESVLAELIE